MSNTLKPDVCPLCQANLALVGRMHRCLPQQQQAAREPEPSHASPNAPSPNDVSPNAHYARNARWRQNHRDRYNAGMRSLMRRKRTNTTRPSA